MSPTLPFVAPILQRAKDGVCQRARGRVVWLGNAVCCFQGVSCAKSVVGGMVFCDGDVSVHSRVTLSSHALHSTHTRNDSSAVPAVVPPPVHVERMAAVATRGRVLVALPPVARQRYGRAYPSSSDRLCWRGCIFSDRWDPLFCSGCLVRLRLRFRLRVIQFRLHPRSALAAAV